MKKSPLSHFKDQAVEISTVEDDNLMMHCFITPIVAGKFWKKKYWTFSIKRYQNLLISQLKFPD